MKWVLIPVLMAAVSCGSNRALPSSKRENQQRIDSLVLVKSLPVYIISKNTGSTLSIEKQLVDSLVKRGFSIIDKQAADDLFKGFMEDLVGLNNPDKMKLVVQKSANDKEYMLKEAELADPLFQYIIFENCIELAGDCFTVKRSNSPNGRKNRTWQFNLDASGSNSSLVSRIMQSLLGN